MRKIINSTYVTLDGVIQDPQDWPELGGFDDSGYRIQDELIQRCDAVLMGRHTYDGFAPVWTAREGDPVSDRMNAITKFVVSTTLTDPEWANTTVIDRDPLDTIKSLKEQPGKDIVQYGFGQLAHALVQAGLLDELRLWIHPFFVGTGTAGDLLHRAGTAGSFELNDVTRMTNGIVVLSYQAKN